MDMWVHILHIRAAVAMQGAFRSMAVRRGPLQYLLKYVSKGWLPVDRACYWAHEYQRRGSSHVHVMTW
jgi:hypothetical protein